MNTRQHPADWLKAYRQRVRIWNRASCECPQSRCKRDDGIKTATCDEQAIPSQIGGEVAGPRT